MSRKPKSLWRLEAYAGVYTNSDTGIKVVVTYNAGALILKVCGAINAVFAVEPHNFASSGWPAGLFELAHCYSTSPRYSVSGAPLSKFSMISFQQRAGQIVGLTWDMARCQQKEKKEREACFDRDLSQTSPLLRLPVEVRSMIMHWVLKTDDSTTYLRSSGAKLVYNVQGINASNTTEIEVNRVQHVCRQLREEYRGLDLRYNRILCRTGDFLRQLTLRDRLIESNMRRVNIHGCQDIIKKKEAHKQLHTTIDFCFRNPDCFVRLVFWNWHYERPHSVIDLVRTGWIIEQALQGTRHRQPIAEDTGAVARLRGGRPLHQLKAKNMCVVPRANYNYAAVKDVFEQRFVELVKSSSRKMRLVLEERPMKKLFEDVEKWHKYGIGEPQVKTQMVNSGFGL